MWFIAISRRGRYGVGGTKNAATPAIGTGSDEPGVLRFETSMEEEEILPLETSMDGFLHVNFTSPKQECIVFEPDVGVDDHGESITSKVQADPGEEFARLPIGRQQRKTASTEENKQFDRSVKSEIITEKRNVLSHILSVYSLFSFCICLLPIVIFFLPCPQYEEAGTKGYRSDWDVPDA